MKQLEGVREDEQLEKTSDRECLHEEKVVENLVEFDVKTQKLPNKNKIPNTHTNTLISMRCLYEKCFVNDIISLLLTVNVNTSVSNIDTIRYDTIQYIQILRKYIKCIRFTNICVFVSQSRFFSLFISIV